MINQLEILALHLMYRKLDWVKTLEVEYKYDQSQHSFTFLRYFATAFFPQSVLSTIFYLNKVGWRELLEIPNMVCKPDEWKLPKGARKSNFSRTSDLCFMKTTNRISSISRFIDKLEHVKTCSEVCFLVCILHWHQHPIRTKMSKSA